MSYLDTQYQPTEKDVVALYSVTPKTGADFEEAIDLMVGEASIGPWNYFWRANETVGTPLRPKVFWRDQATHHFKVAYPEVLFEPKNIPQIMSVLAGNISGMSNLEKVRLIDFTLSKKLAEAFVGPKFGIQGIRNLMSIDHRPLCGVMMKPKIGLDVESFSNLAYDIWIGGCDIVHDAETLTHLDGLPFEERVMETVKKKKKAERETGETKFYFPNITAGSMNKMMRRAEKVSEAGNEGGMINPLLIGWTATQSIISACRKLGLVVYGTRVGHAPFTNNVTHGISPLVLAKWFRFAGVDMSHIVNPVADSEFADKKSMHLYYAFSDHPLYKRTPDDPFQTLSQDWKGIPTVFPVVSGGLHPGQVEPIVKQLETDLICIASEGVFYHPKGIRAGAKALRDACDAAGQHVEANRYAESHPELQIALKKWGNLSQNKNDHSIIASSNHSTIIPS